MLLGTLFVYSATMVNEPAAIGALVQLRAGSGRSSGICLGSGAAAGLCCVDYHTLARWSFIVYWATILMLVAVLFPGIGKTHGWGHGGGSTWARSGQQPSEFAKLAFILAQAHFLSRPVEELRVLLTFWKAIGPDAAAVCV